MGSSQKDMESQIIIQDDDSGLDFKKLIYSFLEYWPWFLLSVFVCMLMAFLYMRYTTPVYNITSKILIKDENGGSSASSGDMMSQFNMLNTQSNVNNEKEVLQTHYLISKVVNEMELNIRYFIVGNIKSTELYKNSPFKIQVTSLKDTIPTKIFNLKFSNKGSAFTIESDDSHKQHSFYDTIKTADINFIVKPVNTYKLQDDEYQVVITSPDAATGKYLDAITFAVSKEASVIQVSLQSTIPRQGEDVLNTIYEVYTRMNEEDKDKIADSTMNFINERLAIVSRELSGVEKDIQLFKEKNKLSIDIPEQASMVLSNANDVQKQLADQDVQISIIQSIQDHLKGNSQRVVPNAVVIQDPTYITAAQEYNNLVLERDRQLETSKPDNPLVLNLNSQIAAVKSNLLVSLDNIKKGMLITRDELVNNNEQFLQNIKTVPSKERVFLDISRQQDIKQQLYLYLLQKREETAISKAGTLTNSRLIEPGKSDTIPAAPQKSIIYLIAFCSGILLPAASIYLKNILNRTITSVEDISKETTVPVIGEIGHNASQEIIVVKQNSRTALAEQFRALRTNFQFLLKGKDHQVIMITSSTSGEGKSFLTINLGASLAISNKKVILVELDLRKPKISNELGLSVKSGFSEFLIAAYKKEDIIKPSGVHPNLFVISSGTIPPNPAELLLDDKVAELFSWLRNEFDYIIVDTPPIGVVIDAVLIGKNADASIYVVRQGYTLKEQIRMLNNFKQHEKIPNLSILVNDVRVSKSYGYGYAYGYGNGYGYGYYSDEKKQKRKLFKK